MSRYIEKNLQPTSCLQNWGYQMNYVATLRLANNVATMESARAFN